MPPRDRAIVTGQHENYTSRRALSKIEQYNRVTRNPEVDLQEK